MNLTSAIVELEKIKDLSFDINTTHNIKMLIKDLEYYND